MNDGTLGYLETSLKKIERAKREWEVTVDTLPQLICLLDAGGRVIRANKTVEAWNLTEVTTVAGTELHDLLHPDCGDAGCNLLRQWRRAREHLNAAKSLQCEIYDKSTARHFRLQFSPIPVGMEVTNGESGSFAVAVIEDISERKLMELELLRAREQEIEIGSRIQQSLLIGQPPRDLSGLHISALAVPSQRIDGDFYAFFKPNDHCLDVVIGDVMGKGVPAALIGAATKNHFLGAINHLVASSAGRQLPEPHEIVDYVHGEMAERLMELESFVTLCYVRFDLKNFQAVLVDCGHPKTLRYDSRRKRSHLLEGCNMPLGFCTHETFKQVTVSFHTEDRFLFYSDGVIEAMRRDGELFGQERLLEFFEKNTHATPGELTERIRNQVATFIGSDELSDDFTCIAIKINELSERPLARDELEVASDLTELAGIRRALRSFCTTSLTKPLDDEEIYQIELAVNEAAANVMKHAYHGSKDQRLRITAEAFEDRLTFTLRHRGKPFRPAAASKPRFDGSQESGFGIYIIDNTMDGVTYSRNESGENSLCLVKYIT